MQLFLRGLATATFCRACASTVANPLPHYLHCHANCSWPAITLDSPRRRLLALWPFEIACCKLLLVVCYHCPISYRHHASIYLAMSRKSLPHLDCQCIYDLPLSYCPSIWGDAPPLPTTTLYSPHNYVEVNLL